mmetsp:Transcript_81200/g.226029  ORF Transcript_81200/g.226029 Transcript_81200/m.226029 type:complete len:333 (+) Transcript_81200:71-1069(+)
MAVPQKHLRRFVVVWTGLCVSSWMYLLTMRSWHEKWTMYYNLEVGLFTVRVSEGLAHAAIGHFVVGEKVSSKFGGFAYGEYSIDKFRSLACAIEIPKVEACKLWTYVQRSTQMFVACVWLGIALLTTGALFTNYNVFEQSAKQHSCYAKVCLCVGPTITLLGFIVYYTVTSQLYKIPPEGGDSTAGHCVAFSMPLVIACFLPWIACEFYWQASDWQDTADTGAETAKLPLAGLSGYGMGTNSHGRPLGPLSGPGPGHAHPHDHGWDHDVPRFHGPPMELSSQPGMGAPWSGGPHFAPTSADPYGMESRPSPGHMDGADGFRTCVVMETRMMA